LKRIGLLFVVSLLLSHGLPASVYGQFGKLGKVLKKAKQFSDLQITEEDEIALGKAVSERVRTRYGVQQDAETTRYVTLVGLVVAQRTSRPSLPYEFIILDSNVINAFAAPGGFVHITRGALAAMKSEAELAGVLAHEIAHITEKHTLKGLQKMKGIELAEDQTSLTANSEVFARIADKAAEAVLQGFGRTEELEADQVGIRFSARCGYEPGGLRSFLETLRGQHEGESSRSGLFASHPETADRIEKLTKQIAAERLSEEATAVLAERLLQFVTYELQKPTDEETSVEGSRGLAGSQGGKEQDKSQEQGKEGEKEKKKSRFSLSRLGNPVSSGEKKESGEVTGAGASRGVGKEDPQAAESGTTKNPEKVSVSVSADDLTRFREEGKLK
jgi:beta-barrel assembly-enhancing protease